MTNDPAYEILPGLPAYGPPAEQFSEDGKGTHREGYVVRFTASDSESWTGNFRAGLTRCSSVNTHPDGNRFVVVASGAGYVVDPFDRHARHYLVHDICDVYKVAEAPILIASTGTCLFAIGRDGELWKTHRLSWDGIHDVRIVYPELRGVAWSPFTDEGVPFTVNLLTGDSTGGSY